MSWDDVKKAKEETNKRGLVNGSYLNLREAGDTCRVTLIGAPEVESKTSPKTGNQYTVAVFRVLTPETERELTLEVFPNQMGNIADLVETHSPDTHDFIVEVVQVGQTKAGKVLTALSWTPVPRTVESQAAADDFGTDEVPFG